MTTTRPRCSSGVPAEEVLIGDLEDLESRAAGCDLLITHSHGRQAAERLEIPFFRMGIPMFDRLGAGHQLSVGYRGHARSDFRHRQSVHGRCARTRPRYVAPCWQRTVCASWNSSLTHIEGAHDMKIAFATQDLKHVDAHFGWAKNIAIYDVSPEGHHFLEAVEFDGDLQEDGNEDKLAPKLEAIEDCAILYVAAIGGSGAARVVAQEHPSGQGQPNPKRSTDSGQAASRVEGTPPPWLRKAMLKDQARELEFRRREVNHA